MLRDKASLLLAAMNNAARATMQMENAQDNYLVCIDYEKRAADALIKESIAHKELAEAVSATPRTVWDFRQEFEAKSRATLVSVLVAIAKRQGAIGLLNHVEDRFKRGEMYFAGGEHITGVKGGE